MELAEFATLALVAGTVTYRTVRQWKSSYQNRKSCDDERSLTLTFTFDRTAGMPETQASLLAFNSAGVLVKKTLQADVVTKRGGKGRVRCVVPANTATVYVLLGSHSFGLNGIGSIEEVERLADRSPFLWVGQAEITPGTTEGKCKTVIALTPPAVGAERGSRGDHGVVVIDTAAHTYAAPCVPAESSILATLIPAEVHTDAMAKCLRFDLCRLHGKWYAEVLSASATSNDDDSARHWMRCIRHDCRLTVETKANFTDGERQARIAIYTDSDNSDSVDDRKEQPYVFTLRQFAMGQHATLNVSRRCHVSDGIRPETVAFCVTPQTESTRWTVKKIATSDGGRWWSLNPRPGTPLTGRQEIRIQLEAKPANLPIRTAIVTLETGTYPFNHTTDVCLMQGLQFDYYIEYPAGDPCARPTGAIETPLICYDEGAVASTASAEWRTYTIRVDSNQPWRIVGGESVSWVRVQGPNSCCGLYGGTFVVGVEENRAQIRNGYPAARSTVLSLVTETGTVRDILIYQGGYVRIKGCCWLDRNLSGMGTVTDVAIPLGLGDKSRRTCGAFFQFGARTPKWTASCGGSLSPDWLEGTEESPIRCSASDPSPRGWRVPSRLELSLLAGSCFATDDVFSETGQHNITLLSDDGVPFYLPLCGYLNHISGSWADMPHSNRYWCGTAKSAVYGYSLCIEPGKQMYITHDMKKYGFPMKVVIEEGLC